MKLLFLDTETTGLDPEKGHAILEITAILIDLEKGEELDRLTTRIHPERTIDEKASEVHGIYPSDLVGLKPFKHHEPAITQIIEKADYLIAHNAEFDCNHLVYAYSRIGKEMKDVNTFDTMTQGRFASFWGRVPTLQELCFASNIEFDTTRAHGSEYDTEKLAEAFMKCHERGHFILS